MIDCFVSYCADDAPDVHVEKLLDELKRLTNNEVNFRVYYEQEYGSSLKDFMRVVLQESHAVLMLFGPKYTSRIEETKQESGVYQEYDTIVSRLEDLSSVARAPKIIPVLWAGKSVEAVLPEYFRSINLKACDLSGFRAVGITQGKPSVPRPTLANYAHKLKEIASQLKPVAQINGDDTIIERNVMLERFLAADGGKSHREKSLREILQPKYELGSYDAKDFKNLYFTSTRAFRRLTSRNVGLVSGRKGSGKTTLVQIGELEAKDTEYFPVIDISVEKWNLHYLIQGNVFKQSEGDFEYMDLEVRLLDYIWPCFTALCMSHSLLQEPHGSSLKPHDLIISSRVADRLKEVAHNSSPHSAPDYSALFALAVQCAKDFMQQVVDRANDESEAQFRLDVIKEVTLRKFLYSLFGSNFQALKAGLLAKGHKKFLFCLDRFDNEIQQYRKAAIERDESLRAERIRREIDWLSSLTLFVHKTLRPDRTAEDKDVFEFFSRVKFLIVLPYDRLIELRNAQRDSVANEAIEEIRWQPRELLTMVRKRIQVWRDIGDEEIEKERNRTPQERFDRVMSLTYPDMPEQVYVAAGGKRHEIDLFLNVLRHSFFRPRDILIHFASILSYADTMAKRKRRPDVETIREAISVETRTIITHEFVGELRDTWRNVEEVLGLFRGGHQVLSARDIGDTVGSTEFQFYDDSTVVGSLGSKVDFLYRIGFLGYRPVRQAGSYRARNDFTFTFLSNTPPPVFEVEASLRQFEFAVHPIFIDSLFLQVNVIEPVLYLDWKALDVADRVD